MQDSPKGIRQQASRVIIPLFIIALQVAFTGICMAQNQYQLKNDAQGGDCTARNLGTWNAADGTCVLAQTVVGTITIASNDITLDGNNLMIRPGAGPSDDAITIANRTGVAITNVIIYGFETGVRVTGGGNHQLSNIRTITGNRPFNTGIWLEDTTGNELTENYFPRISANGIFVWKSTDNLIESNVTMARENGIMIWDSAANVIRRNRLLGGPTRGKNGLLLQESRDNLIEENLAQAHRDGFRIDRSNANTVRFNVLSENIESGIMLASGNDNRTYCNDFRTNPMAGFFIQQNAMGNWTVWNNFYLSDEARDFSLGPNPFNDTKPNGGGNFWQVHANQCGDADRDGFCDNPYAFLNNQDDLPRAAPVPWKADRSLCLRQAPGQQDYEQPEGGPGA